MNSYDKHQLTARELALISRPDPCPKALALFLYMCLTVSAVMVLSVIAGYGFYA